MNEKWLKSLVDPKNKKPLKLKVNISSKGDIVDGKFLSLDGEEFPITKGVPRFVSKDFLSKKEKTKGAKIQTGRSFSDKWKMRYAEKLGDNKIEKKLFEEQFLSVLGAEDRTQLKKIFRNGKNCLDAGCGVGWGEYLFNINENVNRYAVDLSLSVEVAYEKTKRHSNICVVQADLFKLPFKYKFFDIIFSNGVLHHTGDTQKAFSSLCKYLKVGGLIGAYIYCKKPFIRELADMEIRNITTEMSFDECLKFSKQMTKLGKSFKKLEQEIIIEENVPLLGIKKGKYDLQKFIYDNFIKCFYNSGSDEKFSDLINVDWYHPKYADHHSKEEIYSWFEGNGISKIKLIQPKGWQYSGYFISGIKTKK